MHASLALTAFEVIVFVMASQTSSKMFLVPLFHSQATFGSE
jgi:hypothetical protein